MARLTAVLFPALVGVFLAATTMAQERPGGGTYAVPNFWDPAYRQERPDFPERRTIRFLTEAQSPPFSFIGADGLPTGFHVDLARAICVELDMPCTVQTLRWDLLLDGLDTGRGDAIIASLAIDEDARARYAFTRRFLSRPARFVTRRDAEEFEAVPEEMDGRTVAVVQGTAHEAYLEVFFEDTRIVPFETIAAAQAALMEGEVEALFGDGLNLSLWLNGAASRRCCVFRGGPFSESLFFGEGTAIALAPDDDLLRRAFNFALSRLQENGTYGEIYRRYFPISFY
jgi:polar amino acid transport system substrate-binding protein